MTTPGQAHSSHVEKANAYPLKGVDVGVADYVPGVLEDWIAGALKFNPAKRQYAVLAHGTLADADTTIEELYAWQFDGPFLRDFAGRKPVDGRRTAGAIEAQ